MKAWAFLSVFAILSAWGCGQSGAGDVRSAEEKALQAVLSAGHKCDQVRSAREEAPAKLVFVDCGSDGFYNVAELSDGSAVVVPRETPEEKAARATIVEHGFRCAWARLEERRESDAFVVATCPENRYALQENDDPPPEFDVLPFK